VKAIEINEISFLLEVDPSGVQNVIVSAAPRQEFVLIDKETMDIRTRQSALHTSAVAMTVGQKVLVVLLEILLIDVLRDKTEDDERTLGHLVVLAVLDSRVRADEPRDARREHLDDVSRRDDIEVTISVGLDVDVAELVEAEVPLRELLVVPVTGSEIRLDDVFHLDTDRLDAERRGLGFQCSDVLTIEHDAIFKLVEGLELDRSSFLIFHLFRSFVSG